MPKFSTRSTNELATCDKRLQAILNEAIKDFDFTVLCGHRGEKEQNEAFDKGYSKLKFPKSKHNGSPSKAVDIAPYPIDWEDINTFCYFAGYIKGIAHSMSIPIRWGGDFNRNNIASDQSFVDVPHLEIDD